MKKCLLLLVIAFVARPAFAAPITDWNTLLNDLGGSSFGTVDADSVTAVDAGSVAASEPIVSSTDLNSLGDTSLGAITPEAYIAVNRFSVDNSTATVVALSKQVTVPEPSSLVLLGVGALGLVARRRVWKFRS